MTREKHRILVIDHEEFDSTVYLWAATDEELNASLEMVNSCLSRGESVRVSTAKMTERQYDRLPNYEGDC